MPVCCVNVTIADTFLARLPRYPQRRKMNRYFKFRTIFLTTVLGLLFSTAALGQGETTPAHRSALVGVALPQGAHRVNDANVPAEISELLEKMVAQSGGTLRPGDKEVLLWNETGLKNASAKVIIGRLTQSLAAGGWQFEVGGTENGVTVFSLLKGGPDRRALIGIHGEMDGTLIFAWTELHAATAVKSDQGQSVQMSDGSVSDYTFPTPAGWCRSESAGKITLSKDGDKSVTFLPQVDSSGNLERDAERIVWQVFKGYKPWSGNGFEPDYGTFERGRTAQGLEYFRVYRYAIKNGDDSMYGESRFDALILLVKLGNKVAVIAGRQPFQSDYARDSALSAIDLILYDLRFKSAGDAYDLKSAMLGSWAAARGSVGLAYTFNANGSFNKGGAIQFRTSHDATRDKVTTTSYGMTETYSLAGNILTQNYKRTGEVVRYKVRMYETKYNKDAWQQKLGFLPVVDPDRGTIVLKRDN
jgi:hypothetical protein